MIDDALQLVEDALVASNVSSSNARSVAGALVAAEIDGESGHGFSRVAAYAAQARSGKVDGHAKPHLERSAPGLLRVDAGNGFAYPALDEAVEALPAVAAETAIAAASISRSHHCGQLGRHVEGLAERRCVALMFANAPKAMAPWGGRTPLFGTNPIAFACPRKDDLPLVIDLSLSRVARGRVMAAAKAGQQIPEGWALDSDGRPTTDPKAALEGSMVSMGDAKGAALALMVEILAATLTGANYSFEASSFFDAQGEPPGVGQFFVVIDTDRVAGPDFTERLQVLTDAILAQYGTRLPGASRCEQRERCRETGIVIANHLFDEIAALAGR
jgi:(2R)-3-sulfolactate dehydrogenase (NADP+)